MANFESFRWNFLSSKNPETGRSVAPNSADDIGELVTPLQSPRTMGKKLKEKCKHFFPIFSDN